RFEPGPDPRFRLPDALCDRPDPAPAPGVEVEDPVGLAEAQRAQDARLRLVAAPHPLPSLETPPGNPRPDLYVENHSEADYDVYDSLVRIFGARLGLSSRPGP